MNVMHSDHSGRESASAQLSNDSLIQLPLERR
jgi:hypothetical protein